MRGVEVDRKKPRLLIVRTSRYEVNRFFRAPSGLMVLLRQAGLHVDRVRMRLSLVHSAPLSQPEQVFVGRVLKFNLMVWGMGPMKLDVTIVDALFLAFADRRVGCGEVELPRKPSDVAGIRQ